MTNETLTAREAATITVAGSSTELPVVHGTAGDDFEQFLPVGMAKP